MVSTALVFTMGLKIALSLDIWSSLVFLTEPVCEQDFWLESGTLESVWMRQVGCGISLGCFFLNSNAWAWSHYQCDYVGGEDL